MATVFALALGSCAYDPNYAVGGAYGGGYGGGYGYGEGYGYGNSGFSTALFVSTGDPRWGYDPSCYCYYDYHRRCYYDPYLYGYYPMGYRPVVVVGVPHPYGYSRTFCPPPSRVTSITLNNYRNREAAYRNTSYSWAHQVHQQGGTYKGQPQYQQKPTPYAHTGNLTPTANGYPRANNGNAYYKPGENPALRHQQGQPANYNGQLHGNAQGNPIRATPNQGGPKLKAGGGVPQAQMRSLGGAAAPKGRGQGRDGKEDKENGGGRSGR